MRELPVSHLSGSTVFDRGTSASAVDLTLSGAPQESGYLDQIEFLRQSLKDASRPIDSLLAAVAETARVLAGADAAALALRQNGAIICRARSGPLGPELGAPVNTDSGISGECLRTATTLVSADTLQDKRVNPDVCRDLGIRSLAVFPLRAQSGVVGILEAFSGRAGVFESDQLIWLQALAEIAEQLYEREQHPLPIAVPAAAPIGAELLTAIASHSQRGIALLRKVFGEKDYRIIAAAAIIVLIFSTMVWTSFRKPRARVAASNDRQQSPAPAVKNDSIARLTNTPRSPAPRVPANRSNEPSAETLLHKAAELSPATNLTSAHAAGMPDGGITLPRSIKPVTKQPVPDEAPPSVPLVAANNSGAPLSTISTPPALPPYAGPISQITEAKLVRRVEPFYPAQARLQRLQGSVVLEATIAQDGTVRSTKVVSGQAMLAQAASTAVRNWRYTAATLNGKPTEVVTRITIVFKLP
jgi:TonB family protein